MNDSFQEPAFFNSRQECLTHGAILAINTLFPVADDYNKHFLLSRIFPYMTPTEIDYWLSWHNGIKIRSGEREAS